MVVSCSNVTCLSLLLVQVFGVSDVAPRPGISDGSAREVELGRFKFDLTGNAIQTFEMSNKPKPYRMVRIVVDSNSGNPDYTCLYRVRVHGERPEV